MAELKTQIFVETGGNLCYTTNCYKQINLCLQETSYIFGAAGYGKA